MLAGWLFPGSCTQTWRTRLLLVFFLIGIALKVLALAFMATVPLTGDEVFYARGAKLMAQALFFGELDIGLWIERDLVRYGWFMPGMSTLLLPPHLLADTPSVFAIRAWAAFINLLLWVWAIRETDKAFGFAFSLALLLLTALSVGWQVFSASAFADLPAGLVLAVLAARLFTLSQALFRLQTIRIRTLLGLEAILLLLVYLRGSAILIALALHTFLAVLMLLASFRVTTKDYPPPIPWRMTWKRLGGLLLGMGIFSAVLAPWSLTASKILGSPVITTSTTPLSIAITFGDLQKLCFGPCPGDNPWGSAFRFSQKTAQQTGESPLSVQRRMMAEATADLTVGGYLQQVRRNLYHFSQNPTGFPRHFIGRSELDAAKENQTWIYQLLSYPNSAVFFPFLALLLLGNVWVSWNSRETMLVSLIVKMLTLCLFSQVLVHPSHGRYWVTYAPIMAMAAGYLAATLRPPGSPGFLAPLFEHCRTGSIRGNPTALSLVMLQAGYVVAILLFLVVVLAA